MTNEEEDINSRSYRYRRAMAENDAFSRVSTNRLDLDKPPHSTDSGDDTTTTTISGKHIVRVDRALPIGLAPNNRVSQIRYISDVLLRSMRRNVLVVCGWCVHHGVCVFQQTDLHGSVWKDYANDSHGVGADSPCHVIQIPSDMLFDLCDKEEPKIGEFFAKVKELKEMLDEQADRKLVNESKHRVHIEELRGH